MAVKKQSRDFDIVEYEFRKGITLSFGFEGVRFDVGLKATTSKANIETVKQILSNMVEDDLDRAATEYMKPLELSEKAGQLARLYKEKSNASQQ